MEPPPTPPPHYSIGGGYHGVHGTQQQRQQQSYQSQEADRQQHTHDEQHHHHQQHQPRHYPPHHAHQQQTSHQLIMAQEEMDLNQRIAQKMLTAQAPSSPSGGYGNNPRNNQDAYDVGIHHHGIPQPQLVPPWETGGAPTIQSDTDHLSVSQLHQALLHPSYPAIDSNNNNVTKSISNENSTVEDNAAASTATPKSVTFGTHDQFFQWDEQLEMLKYADEEFFNVAHFLIDVIGVNNEENIERYTTPNDDDDIWAEKNERKELPGHGVLSRIFGCSVGREVDSFEAVYNWEDQEDNNKGGRSNRQYLTEKLVRDFVKALEFRMANIKSNSSSCDSEEEEDNIVVTKTREIARKVNAYGLPLLPSSRKAEKGRDGKNEVLSKVSDKEEEDEDDVEFLDTFGLGIGKHFFPVLPINDDDDENGGGADENDQSLSSQLGSAKSYDTRDLSLSIKQAPTLKITPESFLCSIAKPKPKSSSSKTPNEDECQKRLAQIPREIKKAQKMIDNTQNISVQSACQKRITKLTDERRFYQIIQERHKIQSMMETTEVAFVRAACKERFKQLILELQTLKLEEEEEDDEEVENTTFAADEDGPVFESVCKVEAPVCEPKAPVYDNIKVVCEQPAVAVDKDNQWYDRVLAEAPLCEPKGPVCEQPAFDKDSQWYDRVLQYVTGEQPLHEEMSVARSARSNHSRNGTLAEHQQPLERNGYNNPEQYQEQLSLQHSQGHRSEQSQHGSQVRFAESHYSLQGSDRHHDRYGDTQSVRSPRSDEAVVTQNNNSQNPRGQLGFDPNPTFQNPQNPRGQQGRRPVATRRPVASAVKRTAWFGCDVMSP